MGMKRKLFITLATMPFVASPIASLISCSNAAEKITIAIQTDEFGVIVKSSLIVDKGQCFGDIKDDLAACVEAKYTYKFAKWVNNKGEEIKDDFNINEDNFIAKALFDKIQIDINVTCDQEHGQVISPVFKAPMGSLFKDIKPDLVECIRVDNSGYWFDKWVNENKQEINDDLEIVESFSANATFTNQTYDITITADEHGFISENLFHCPQGTKFGTIKPYINRYVRPIYADKELYEFDKWVDATTGLEIGDDKQIDSALTVKALFKKQQATLSISCGIHGKVVHSTWKVDRHTKYETNKDDLIACIEISNPQFAVDRFENEQGEVINDWYEFVQDEKITAIIELAPFTIGDFVYRLGEPNGYATVIGYIGDNTEIEVPGSIEDEKGINHTVIAAADGLFGENTNITKVTLPESLIHLGKDMFYTCTKLQLVTISKNVTVLPERCFKNCYELVDVAIIDDETGKVKEIKDACFQYCSKAEFSSLPSTVEILGNQTFQGCEKLTSVSLPNIKSAGTECFRSCSNLNKITIPSTWEVIGKGCFEACEALTTVDTTDGKNSQLRILSVDAFRGCHNLVDITIPDAVERIEDNCFDNCSGLRHVVFPQGLKQIGSEAFAYCPKLENTRTGGAPGVEYEGTSQEWENVKKIRDSFRDTPATDVTCADEVVVSIIPDDITVRIHILDPHNGSVLKQTLDVPVDATFQFVEDHCDINHCVKPDTGYSIKYWVYENGLNIRYNEVISTNITCKPIIVKEYTPSDNDDITYGLDDEDHTAIALSHNRDCPEEEIIPETITADGQNYTVTAIGPEYSAQSAQGIKRYVIPETVTWLGTDCFRGLLGLEEITLPKNLTYLPKYCFATCLALKKINLKETNIEQIGPSCFESCEALTDIILPESLKFLDDACFNNCKSLEQVTLPSGLKQIGPIAFNDCPKLTDKSGAGETPGFRFTGTISQWENVIKGNNWHDNDVTLIVCQKENIPIDAGKK